MTDRCVTTTYPNGGYCVDCDEQEFIAPVPEHVDTVIDAAWDAGANSVRVVEAPCYVQWSPKPETFGECIGLIPLLPIRSAVGDPTNIPAAFYVFISGITMFAQPKQFGVDIGTPHAITTATVLRIEHVGAAAHFLLGSVQIASCSMPPGANRAAIAMYRSNDALATPTFAALTSFDVGGSGGASLRCVAKGSWTRDHGVVRIRCTAHGGRRDNGHANLRCTAIGHATTTYGGARMTCTARGSRGMVIPVPNVGTAKLTCTARGDGIIVDAGSMSGHLRCIAKGNWAASHGGARMRCTAKGSEIGQEAGVLLLLQSPGVMLMTIGYSRETIGDTISLADAATQQLINAILETIAFTAAPSSYLQAIQHLVENIDVIDQIGVLWKLLLAETVNVIETVAPTWIAIERAFEILRLIAGPSSSVQLLNLLIETIGINEALAIVIREQINEAAAFTETVTTRLAAAETVVESVLLDAVPSGSARMAALVEESFAIGANPATSLHAFEQLIESMSLSMTVHIGDDLYLAWVVNTETRGATTYANFPFNSFCDFDDPKQYYGAADDGIYELEGSTDDGDAITASVRKGLDNLGTGKEKRFPSMYLGYRASGPLVLKVTTVETDGSRIENWYRIVPRGDGEIREGRIQIGRGLRSVYWDFEIMNVDGADFDFADLKLFPLILDRRIRGRDG